MSRIRSAHIWSTVKYRASHARSHHPVRQAACEHRNEPIRLLTRHSMGIYARVLATRCKDDWLEGDDVWISSTSSIRRTSTSVFAVSATYGWAMCDTLAQVAHECAVERWLCKAMALWRARSDIIEDYAYFVDGCGFICWDYGCGFNKNAKG